MTDTLAIIFWSLFSLTAAIVLGTIIYAIYLFRKIKKATKIVTNVSKEIFKEDDPNSRKVVKNENQSS